MMSSDDFFLQARWPDGLWSAEDEIAQITIRVSDKILTRLADASSGETRNYVLAPPVPLALWFIENWWRLRYEPFLKP